MFAAADGVAHCFVCRDEGKAHNIKLSSDQLRFFEGRFAAPNRFANLKYTSEPVPVCKSCVRSLRKAGLAPDELDQGWHFVEGT
jgi:hypothetical protein